MSKTIPAGIQATIAGGTTRLAWAITITRADGQVYRYCSGTRNKTIGGQAFVASPGFTVSNLTCTEGASVVDTLQLTMLAQDDLQKVDFLAGRWNGARVEFNEFDWSDPSLGLIPWPTFRVSDVQPIAGAFVLELRDVRVMWGHNYTLYTGKECQERLGNVRVTQNGTFGCQVDLAPFTFAFEVVSVSSARRQFVIDVAQPADYFTEGYLVWDTGQHIQAGMQQLIRDHATGDVVTLAVPLLADVTVGMTGEIVAGCLKRLEDCRDKFDNLPNMRAPGVHAPTVEELVGG